MRLSRSLRRVSVPSATAEPPACPFHRPSDLPRLRAGEEKRRRERQVVERRAAGVGGQAEHREGPRCRLDGTNVEHDCDAGKDLSSARRMWLASSLRAWNARERRFSSVSLNRASGGSGRSGSGPTAERRECAAQRALCPSQGRAVAAQCRLPGWRPSARSGSQSLRKHDKDPRTRLSPTRKSDRLTWEPREASDQQKREGDEEPGESGFDGRLEVFGGDPGSPRRRRAAPCRRCSRNRRSRKSTLAGWW